MTIVMIYLKHERQRPSILHMNINAKNKNDDIIYQGISFKKSHM
jgi:hypothetical protein